MGESPQKPRGVPIRHLPETTDTRFANHFIIQHTEHEFMFSFYELRTPILLGSDEDKRKQFDQLDFVEALCVARVVVSAERMPKLVEMLEENLTVYREKREEREAKNE